jgi:hemolysin activation/secretion protein
VQTVRGQRAGAAIGDAFWMSSLELGTSSVGIRKIVFGDLGWAGSRTNFSHPGRPLSGAGVGASFMDGLIRIDLAKGIYPEKSVRANLYVEARF